MKGLFACNLFQDKENILINRAPGTEYNKYIPTPAQKNVEVLGSSWYESTYEKLITEPNHQFLVPLIFYTDKTGTDPYQRYPLEPFMFSTPILTTAVRQKADAWRHLGFIPSCTNNINAEKNLQQYHEVLDILLEEIKKMQQHPPVLKLSFLGKEKYLKIIFSVAFIIGDQLSQDQQCCRKSINKNK